MDVLVIVAAYFVAGLCALLGFDAMTGRIRRNFMTSSTEAQISLINSGNAIGTWGARILLAIAVWLFWPLVFVGVVREQLTEGGSHGEKKQGADREDTGRVGKPDSPDGG